MVPDGGANNGNLKDELRTGVVAKSNSAGGACDVRDCSLGGLRNVVLANCAERISAGGFDTAAGATPDVLEVELSWDLGSGTANEKPDGEPNTGGRGIAAAVRLVGGMTDGWPNVWLGVVGILGVDVPVAKIDGP